MLSYYSGGMMPDKSHQTKYMGRGRETDSGNLACATKKCELRKTSISEGGLIDYIVCGDYFKMQFI